MRRRLSDTQRKRLREELFRAQGGKCAICGEAIVSPIREEYRSFPQDRWPSIHHENGDAADNREGNLKLAHVGCNAAEWMVGNKNSDQAIKRHDSTSVSTKTSHTAVGSLESGDRLIKRERERALTPGQRVEKARRELDPVAGMSMVQIANVKMTALEDWLREELEGRQTVLWDDDLVNSGAYVTQSDPRTVRKYMTVLTSSLGPFAVVKPYADERTEYLVLKRTREERASGGGLR